MKNVQLLLLFIFFLTVPLSSFAKELRIATWNLEWLRDDLNVGKKKRTAEDYRLIAKYAQLLDADIIAVQEVEGKKGLRRIFDPSTYNFLISKRNNIQRVGMAIKKGIKYRRNKDYTELNTSGGLRHGIDVTILNNDRSLRLLAVHLKSGCFSDNYNNSNRKACTKLKAQVPILESWVDQRAEDNQAFIVLGDFNRRLSRTDILWQEIDDHKPQNADLTLHTQSVKALCYNSKYPKFIDHIITDKLSTLLVLENSFTQYIYSSNDMKNFNNLPDHCPISVNINL